MMFRSDVYNFMLQIAHYGINNLVPNSLILLQNTTTFKWDNCNLKSEMLEDTFILYLKFFKSNWTSK